MRTKLHTVKKYFEYYAAIILIEFVLYWRRVTGDFVFITGADTSHFKSVKQLLRSYFQFESESKIIFYDLGLTVKERDILQKEFPELIYKKFNYSLYPDYFDIKKEAGAYAWKPVIFWNTLNEYKCKVFWMDAGTVITDSLEKLKKYICLKGYFWIYSTGTVELWTHEKTLMYLQLPEKFYKSRNLAAGAVGVDYDHKKALELASEWKECAMTKECIAPEGSNRSNHRQDQSALTVLAYKQGLAKGLKLRRPGFKIQQDID